MNISKYIAFAAVAAAAFGAFAADPQTGVTVWFTSEGDRYANGDEIPDKEWYALCWSADGVFEGITPKYEALGAGDRVVRLMQVTKQEGNVRVGCYVLTNAEATELAGGKYCVIALDTRNGSETPAGKTEEGKPDCDLAAAKAYTSGDVVKGKADSTVSTAVSNAGWDNTIPESATTATIAGIDVNAKIEVRVNGMMEGVRYNLKSGDTPTTVETYGTPVTATNTYDTIKVDKTGDAKFFKLTHEPLAR